MSERFMTDQDPPCSRIGNDTMTVEHTKGPWDDGIHHAVTMGGRTISYVRSPSEIAPIAAVPLGVEGYGREECEANARLIASAPELLECLKDTRRLLTDQDAIDLVHIDEVIAKAESRAALSPDNSTQKKEEKL